MTSAVNNLRSFSTSKELTIWFGFWMDDPGMNLGKSNQIAHRGLENRVNCEVSTIIGLGLIFAS